MTKRYILPLTEMIDEWVMENYGIVIDYTDLEIKSHRDYDSLIVSVDSIDMNGDPKFVSLFKLDCLE